MSLRNFFSTSGGELSPAIIIRRALFLLLLIGLMFFYLAPGFRGLTHPKGIDQAQIAREIARGNGFQTKMIRPLSLYQAKEHSGDVALVGFHDTYHAPLNPLVNSVILNFFKGDPPEGDGVGVDGFTWDRASNVYFLDRVIAGVSIILLLASIGISYLLVSRIFDAKIGGVTALLMLLCELFWRFSQTGLPQMLMLFLFSFGTYFLYKAIEAQNLGRAPMFWVALCAGFFGLLALAHWLAVWPFVGLLIFSAFYFKPRGAASATMAVVFLVIILPWGIRNASVSGTPFGSGYFAVLGGMGVGEEDVMRSYDPRSENIFRKGFASKVLVTSIGQLNGLYAFLGSIAVAPLFFLSLLHPFKRPEIAAFRWCILAMWLASVLGMSLFGLPEGKMDANQLHVLFIPLMTAYGLAFLSVLWSRLGIISNVPMVTNGHLVLAVFFSVVPMILGLIPSIPRSLYGKEQGTQSLQISYIRDAVDPAEVVVSDAPWTVGWYGDRSSLWLPATPAQMKEISAMTEQKGQPLSGVLLTMRSANQPMIADIIYGSYRDWAPMIVGQAMNYSIGSMRDMPFTTPDRAMRDRRIFYLVEPK